MANENKPLVEVKPGDPITAGRWNDMQRALRQEHIAHTHTGAWKEGLFDGAPITDAGLADGAVTNPRLADNAVSGAKVDPRSDLHIRTLTISGQDLAVDASALAVTGPVQVTGPLKINGAAALGNLKVSGASEHASLAVSGQAALSNLKVAGTSEHASLAVSGQAALSNLKVAGTSEHASLAVSGPATLASLLVKGKHAVVAEGAPPRIVYGFVSAEGSIQAGSGFKVALSNDGPYFQITFEPAFRSVPCIITQQVGDGNTRDNNLVDDPQPAGVRVYTGDSSGDRRWRAFFFLAIGPG